MQLCLRCLQKFAAADWQCPCCHYQPRRADSLVLFAPNLAESKDGFPVENVDELARLEMNHFWFRARNQLIAWALRKYFAGSRNFLEIGCGTGCVLAHLRQTFPRLHLSGSEVLLKSLAWSQRRLPDVTLFQMDARHIPFTQEFDVIGAFDVLEHIEEDESVLQQMFQAVKPGGGILLTVPQHRFLWSRDDEYAHHKRRYERADLIGKMRRAGFSLVRVTSFVSFLLPLVWLSRRWARHGPYDPCHEFHLPFLAKAGCAAAMALERAFLQAGVSLPIGSSLLAIARRPPAGGGYDEAFSPRRALL